MPAIPAAATAGAITTLALWRVRVVTGCDRALVTNYAVRTVNAQFAPTIMVKDLPGAADGRTLRWLHRARTLAPGLGNCPLPIIALHDVTRVSLTGHCLPSLWCAATLVLGLSFLWKAQ